MSDLVITVFALAKKSSFHSFLGERCDGVASVNVVRPTHVCRVPS